MKKKKAIIFLSDDIRKNTGIHIKRNCDIPPLIESDVRVMFDDGEGVICIDFEKGIVNDEIRRIVSRHIAEGSKKHV